MTALAETLSQENLYIQKFIELLEREHDALKARAIDQLEQITQEKETVVAQLNAFCTQRTNLLELPSAPAAQKEFMQTWFRNHPGESRALALWSELLANATKARGLHEANSQIVALLLKTTNAALEILTKPPQEALLYDSGGQANTITGSRIVDSA